MSDEWLWQLFIDEQWTNIKISYHVWIQKHFHLALWLKAQYSVLSVSTIILQDKVPLVIFEYTLVSLIGKRMARIFNDLQNFLKTIFFLCTFNEIWCQFNPSLCTIITNLQFRNNSFWMLKLAILFLIFNIFGQEWGINI